MGAARVHTKGPGGIHTQSEGIPTGSALTQYQLRGHGRPSLVTGESLAEKRDGVPLRGDPFALEFISWRKGPLASPHPRP